MSEIKPGPGPDGVYPEGTSFVGCTFTGDPAIRVILRPAPPEPEPRPSLWRRLLRALGRLP